MPVQLKITFQNISGNIYIFVGVERKAAANLWNTAVIQKIWKWDPLEVKNQHDQEFSVMEQFTRPDQRRQINVLFFWNNF